MGLARMVVDRADRGRRILDAEIVLEIIRNSGSRPRERMIDMGFRVIRRESTAPPG